MAPKREKLTGYFLRHEATVVAMHEAGKSVLEIARAIIHADPEVLTRGRQDWIGPRDEQMVGQTIRNTLKRRGFKPNPPTIRAEAVLNGEVVPSQILAICDVGHETPWDGCNQMIMCDQCSKKFAPRFIRLIINT